MFNKAWRECDSTAGSVLSSITKCPERSSQLTPGSLYPRRTTGTTGVSVPTENHRDHRGLCTHREPPGPPGRADSKRVHRIYYIYSRWFNNPIIDFIFSITPGLHLRLLSPGIHQSGADRYITYLSVPDCKGNNARYSSYLTSAQYCIWKAAGGAEHGPKGCSRCCFIMGLGSVGPESQPSGCDAGNHSASMVRGLLHLCVDRDR